MKYWGKIPYNPVIGCSKCSPGCQNCYAERLHTQRHKALLAGKKVSGKCYRKPFSAIQLLEDRLDIPLRRKTPTVFFVCNMSDLFHKDVPFEFIEGVFHQMHRRPQHTFLVLTKRPKRMLRYYKERKKWTESMGVNFKTLPNLWLGTTVCNQAEKEKIDLLRQTPAAHRWLSLEPLLEDLGELNLEGIDQVILGGESGPNARPMKLEWAKSVRNQCKEAGVPFMFKQWGPKSMGRLLNNKIYNDLAWRQK
jgi:protein gp37